MKIPFSNIKLQDQAKALKIVRRNRKALNNTNFYDQSIGSGLISTKGSAANSNSKRSSTNVINSGNITPLKA